MTESHAPQVSIPVPTQTQSNQEHIEKIFPKLAIKACSFLQLFCAAFAVIIQVCFPKKILCTLTAKILWLAIKRFMLYHLC